MPTLIIETFINAPAEVCFDLLRDVRVHAPAVTKVARPEEGAMGVGQVVTFEGRILGFRRILSLEVTEFERPRLLVDEMIDGAFATFKHAHEFADTNGGTIMRDTVIWTSPVGPLGRLADRAFVEAHLRRLVKARNGRLKLIAEGGAEQAGNDPLAYEGGSSSVG
jgi:ligand-binding SRPBCC domain-containing protein